MSASALRKNAWDSLRTTYWMALVAVLIISGITYLAESIIGQFVSVIFTALGIGSAITSATLSKVKDMDDLIYLMQGSNYALLSSIQSLVGVALSIFVSEVLAVGLSKFMLKARTGVTEITDIFTGFSKNYLNIVTVSFFKNLYIFLWSLLFIIPGIIKTYEYAAVPYLLANNPSLDYKTALETSSRIMDGKKGELFFLQLSFIGWMLLGCIACCGIGTIFVTPYYNAAQAEFFCYAYSDALSLGKISNDLNM